MSFSNGLGELGLGVMGLGKLGRHQANGSKLLRPVVVEMFNSIDLIA